MTEALPLADKTLYQFLATADPEALRDWFHLPGEEDIRTLGKLAFGFTPPPVFHASRLIGASKELDPDDSIPAPSMACSIVSRAARMAVHEGELTVMGAGQAFTAMMSPVDSIRETEASITLSSFVVPPVILSTALGHTTTHLSNLSRQFIKKVHDSRPRSQRLLGVLPEVVRRIEVSPPDFETLQEGRIQTLMTFLFKDSPLAEKAVKANLFQQMAVLTKLCGLYRDEGYHLIQRGRHKPLTSIRYLWQYCQGLSEPEIREIENTPTKDIGTVLNSLVAVLGLLIEDNQGAIQQILSANTAAEVEAVELRLLLDSRDTEEYKKRLVHISWGRSTLKRHVTTRKDTRERASTRSAATGSKHRAAKQTPPVNPPSHIEAALPRPEHLELVLMRLAERQALSDTGTTGLLVHAGLVAPNEKSKLPNLGGDLADFMKGASGLSVTHLKIGQSFFGKNERAPVPLAQLDELVDNDARAADPDRTATHYLIEFCEAWVKSLSKSS